MDSLWMRSRSIEDSTSCSVTSIARTTASPGDHEAVGGQEIGQARRVEESGPETLERVRRERGHLAAHADVSEVRQELELEVPFQTAVRHAEHERKIEGQLEPVHALENERPRFELGARSTTVRSSTLTCPLSRPSGPRRSRSKAGVA